MKPAPSTRTGGRRKLGPGRPATPLITRDATAVAALGLIDRDGLDALSLQAVAKAMTVAAPSLYHHFRDKDDLLELVATELLRQIGERAQPDLGWQDRVVALAVATRGVILEHAKAAPLLLRFFPRRLMLGAYERTLRDCPFPEDRHMIVLEAIEKLTYGTALYAAAAAAQDSPAMPGFDPDRYRALARAQQSASRDEEAVFVEALLALIDGFHVRFGTREMVR